MDEDRVIAILLRCTKPNSKGREAAISEVSVARSGSLADYQRDFAQHLSPWMGVLIAAWGRAVTMDQLAAVVKLKNDHAQDDQRRIAH